MCVHDLGKLYIFYLSLVIYLIGLNAGREGPGWENRDPVWETGTLLPADPKSTGLNLIKSLIVFISIELYF